MIPEGLSTTATFEDLPLRPVAVRPTLFGRLTAVWRRRELLANLVRKELRLRYQSSLLGFAWSFATPLLYLLVFSGVFQYVMRVDLPRFGLFLVTGLILWNVFSASVSSATVSVSGNPNLIKRVWFPREILPLAAIIAQLVHLMLQLLVLVGALLLLRHEPAWEMVPLLPVAVLCLVLFAAAVGMTAGALMAFLRDTQHVVELGLVAGFWITPIVYPASLVIDRLPTAAWLLGLNPVAAAVTTFQHALYNHPELVAPSVGPSALPAPGTVAWQVVILMIGLVVASVAFVGALGVFARMDERFAEQV